MNERIKKLAMECGAWTQVYENIKGNNDRLFLVNNTFNVEKFAELIVRECVNICKQGNDTQMSSGGAADAIKYHFGVK